MPRYLKPRSFLDKIHKRVDYMRNYMQGEGIDEQVKQDISLMEDILRRANNQSTQRNRLDVYETTLIEVVESLISNGCPEAVISWAMSEDCKELRRRPADPEAIAIKESRLLCLRFR